MLSAMNVILIRTYYSSSIPEALYEAAKIDGASHLYIFKKNRSPHGKTDSCDHGSVFRTGYWND